MQKLFASLIIFICTIGSSLAAVENPSEFLEITAKKLIADIEKNKATLKTDTKLAEKLAKQHLLPIIDTEGFAKRTLGKKTWTSMTAKQQKEFEDGFINQVINKYAKGLAFYDGQAFIFEKPEISPSGNAAKVKSSMKQADAENLHIDYLLAKSDDQWLITNIYVEGADMRESYKNQFLPRINEIGIAEFIKELNKPDSAK